MAEEFESALENVPDGARAQIFRAEGKVFCGGVKRHHQAGRPERLASGAKVLLANRQPDSVRRSSST